MNAKTLSFGLIIALVTAMLAAGMTVVGTHLLRMDEATGSSFLSGLPDFYHNRTGQSGESGI